MMRLRIDLAVIGLGGLILFAGCGERRPARDALSPAAYFEKTQSQTMTPHGRVRSGSAEPAGDGKLRYQTEDGTTWEVTATPAGNGYRYSDPRPVK